VTGRKRPRLPTSPSDVNPLTTLIPRNFHTNHAAASDDACAPGALTFNRTRRLVPVFFPLCGQLTAMLFCFALDLPIFLPVTGSIEELNDKYGYA
jgi:hypothetical protein